MLKHRNDAGCQGKDFYDYYAFTAAAQKFPAFGRTGDLDTRKREITAFFAHTSHATSGAKKLKKPLKEADEWGYCTVTDEDKSVHCDHSIENRWPCYPDEKYYGRGPFKLKWNYNYGPCGDALGVNLLSDPRDVAVDPVISFQSAIWYFMDAKNGKPSPHSVMVGFWKPSIFDIFAGRTAGFGLTTNIINGEKECGRGPNLDGEDRIRFYLRYCKLLGVDPGSNLDCYAQQPFGNGMNKAVAM